MDCEKFPKDLVFFVARYGVFVEVKERKIFVYTRKRFFVLTTSLEHIIFKFFRQIREIQSYGKVCCTHFLNSAYMKTKIEKCIFKFSLLQIVRAN